MQVCGDGNIIFPASMPTTTILSSSKATSFTQHFSHISTWFTMTDTKLKQVGMWCRLELNASFGETVRMNEREALPS
jgi:hypothetical protein